MTEPAQQMNLIPEDYNFPSRAVECLGHAFESDLERRNHYLSRLRAALEELEAKLGGIRWTSVEDAVAQLKQLDIWQFDDDNALHKLVERMREATRGNGRDKDLLQLWKDEVGFPHGSIEDILRLSDPPYYTPCPNPFIREFIEYYGSAYAPDLPSYSREPYAADSIGGKNDPIYNLHSYHTKVPPRILETYIRHYTDENSIILDAFSGSGMTGIGAKYANRSVILCDLAPAASFIANNYNNMPDPSEFQYLLRKLLLEVRKECGWMYIVEHDSNSIGILTSTVFSEVFFCPNCMQELIFWEFDKTSVCSNCKSLLTKEALQRKLTPTGTTERVPVRLEYQVGKKRFKRAPIASDIALLKRIEETEIPYPYPNDFMMHLPPPWGDYYRKGYHQGFERIPDFYTRRNLYAIACMWAKIEEHKMPTFMKFLVTSLLAMRSSLRMPYREGGSAGAINNLHIPSLTREYNPIGVLERKGNDFAEVVSAFSAGRGERKCLVTTQSATRLSQFPSNSIDYIYIDPPFGDNIIYSELNFLWEAWLRVFSAQKNEAIVSKYQRKGFSEYEYLMQLSFEEMYRLLKPGHWLTIQFHNSQNSIWNAIQSSLSNAGFVIADVRTLDKQQGSYKQVSTVGAVKQDLVISAYKANGGLEERFKLEAGTENGVWDFIRTHLRQLPVFVSKDGQVEVVAERQNYLLFDRMVAFHVQRGVTVPLSASEFYAGLEQRFPYRDGMYFLPEQVAEYDRKRMSAKEVLQLTLIVTDEASAIQWLRQQLTKKPQSFQDLHPQFMRQISGWSKHEVSLELRDLLEQNFLRYEGVGEVPSQIHGYLSTNYKELRNLDKDDPSLRSQAADRWYVPDPNKAGDLEKLRERALLREFDEYLASKSRKLKVFRLEAVRAGFKKAWGERNYATILEVAEKLPDAVLQEDPKLLMWYDQALTRSGR